MSKPASTPSATSKDEGLPVLTPRPSQGDSRE
jgi:hypothetical protein